MFLQTTLENIKNFSIVVVSIILPVLLLAFGVITFLHYRRKKKLTEELAESSAAASYNNSRDFTGDKNHSAIIEQLEYRHQQLKTEFELLEEKYHSAIGSGNNPANNQTDRQLVLENEIKGYEATINVLKQEKSEMYKALKEAESLQGNMANSSSESVRSLETKIKELENDLQGMNAQNKEMCSLIETVEQKYENTVQQNRQLQDEYSAIANHHPSIKNADEYLQLGRQLEDIQAQKKMLEDQQAVKEQEIHSSNDQIKELHNYIEQLRGEVSAKEQLLKTIVFEKEQAIEQLNNKEANDQDAENMHQQFAEIQNHNTQLQQQVDVLNQQIKESDGAALAQNYLNDLLEEKKHEISFLQTQLEQRIKNFHLMENQYQFEIEKGKQTNFEIVRLNQTINELRSLVDEKEEKIKLSGDEINQAAQENLLQIDALHNKINDLNKQNANLSALIEQEAVSAKNTRNHLEEQKLKTAMLEQTLKEYVNLFEKISTEIAKSNGNPVLQLAEERG